MIYDLSYLMMGVFALRLFGGKWAWHLAEHGTQDSTITDKKVRAAYYRDAMGRPTSKAYAWGLVVGILVGAIWPAALACLLGWKLCSNERTQDLVLPGTNAHYEKLQEQHNHLTRLARASELKALEAEVLDREEA